MLPWWLLAGVACLALVQSRCAGEREGALRAELARLEAAAARVDTVYHTDTLRLTKTRRVTDSILVPGDTVTRVRVDTVRMLVQAERVACDAALRTCEERVALRDQRIAVLEKARPGRFGCVVGPAVTHRGVGIGGSCGYRLK